MHCIEGRHAWRHVLPAAIAMLALGSGGPALAGHYTGPVYSGGTYTLPVSPWSANYSSYGGGWGGHAGAPSGSGTTARCQGEITATFTWVRDYDGDDPPSEVVLTETSTATWDATKVPDQPSGDCNDGIGDSPVNHMDELFATIPVPPYHIHVGWHGYGTSSGTRYTVKQGTDPLVVTCTPSASATTSGSVPTCSVAYCASVTPVTIALGGGVTTSGGKRYLIGQEVSASIACGELTVLSGSWSVSGGSPFKSFTATDTSTSFEALALPSEDMPLTFYFARTGTAEITWSGQLQTPSGAVVGVSSNATVGVDAPDFESSALIGSNGLRCPGIAGKPSMQLMNCDVPPPWISSMIGTAWPARVYEPAAYVALGSGQWGWAQIVTFYVRFYDGVGDTYYVIADPNNPTESLNGKTGLDGGFLYNGVSYADDGHQGSWDVGPPLGNGPRGDAPGVSVLTVGNECWTSIRANHQFTTYMLYKPPDSDGLPSTFVPLFKFNWSWVGHGGPFQYDGQNLTGTVSDDGSSLGGEVSFPSFPSWQRAMPRTGTGTIIVDPNQNP